MSKDWTGDSNSVYKTLGASNHTDKERQNEDYYATDSVATELLLEMEDIHHTVIDNSVGEGHLMKYVYESGRTVSGYDVVDRTGGTLPYTFTQMNWLDYTPSQPLDVDIIMNPPYSLAKEFVEHSLDVIQEGRKVCAFLKIQFMEGKKRKQLFTQQPPKRIWISSSRLLCAKNGDFENARVTGSAVAYAWYVWEKGHKGETVVKWFN